MSLFKYKAIHKETDKHVVGMVDAASEAEAVKALQERNYEILFLSEERGSSIDQFLFKLTRIKNKDIVIFARQFSVLISASVTLVNSLKILVDQIENVRFKSIIQSMANDVDAGMKLSDALAKHPTVFSKFFINVVRSGESSGKLDEVLEYLADELEKDYDMTAKIKGAMIYPAFVLTGLVFVGIFMMVVIVPKLTGMLLETGGELPVATKILIAVSDFFVGFWWLVVLGLVGAVIGFKIFYKSSSGKKIVDTLVLKLPVFGHLLHLIYLVRFARSMNTLLVGGVNITDGLKIVAEVVDNAVYKEIITEARTEVEEGNNISDAFLNRKEIPAMVSQMLKVGEKTGRLDQVLTRITEFYSREIANIVANLMTLMEPIIMIIMGIGVGLMVAAIIMPMYQMSANL